MGDAVEDGDSLRKRLRSRRQKDRPTGIEMFDSRLRPDLASEVVVPMLDAGGELDAARQQLECEGDATDAGALALSMKDTTTEGLEIGDEFGVVDWRWLLLRGEGRAKGGD